MRMCVLGIKNWVMFILRLCEWWSPLWALSTCRSNFPFTSFNFQVAFYWICCRPVSLNICFSSSGFHVMTVPANTPISVHISPPHPPHLHRSLQPSAAASRIQIYRVQWSASLPPLPPLSWSWMTIMRGTGPRHRPEMLTFSSALHTHWSGWVK